MQTNKIARIFPRRTKQTPCDSDAYTYEPDLLTPHYDIAMVSVTFTWDIPRANQLAKAWESHADKVMIGGPAFGDPGNTFTPGMFVKQGVVFTSRGCPNKCKHCYVPVREGQIRELEITPGNIIQDNNLFACSRAHIEKVFQMLKTQYTVKLSGGIESSTITDWIVEELRGIRLNEIWLAYDSQGRFESVKKAVEKLQKYYNREKIRCFVMIGYEGDTINKARDRLIQAYNIGTYPFAMQYTNDQGKLNHSKEWLSLGRTWCRPAIYKAYIRNHIKHGGIR